MLEMLDGGDGGPLKGETKVQSLGFLMFVALAVAGAGSDNTVLSTGFTQIPEHSKETQP